MIFFYVYPIIAIVQSTKYDLHCCSRVSTCDQDYNKILKNKSMLINSHTVVITVIVSSSPFSPSLAFFTHGRKTHNPLLFCFVSSTHQLTRNINTNKRPENRLLTDFAAPPDLWFFFAVLCRPYALLERTGKALAP